MKRMGVLGGIGPQATMDFEARVHVASQRLIPQHGEEGYPPMAVIYVRHAPILLEPDESPCQPLAPDPRLFDAARQLGSWADFLVMPCNIAHMFVEQIAQVAGCPVLSMVDAVVAEVQRRRLGTVGLLGFGQPLVYEQALDQAGIAWRGLAPERRPLLNAQIRALMEGRHGPESYGITAAAVDTLRALPVDGVVLGCTELPLLLGEAAGALDLINPAALLAEAAVRYAIA